MDEGSGMQASTVVHPVMTMSEAEQEQAMQLAQMAQQRAMQPSADQSLGEVHEHQHSTGLVNSSEVPHLKYCRNCGEMKPRKDYHRNHSKADELEDVCKPCKAQRDAARRRNRATVVPSVEFKVCKKCAEEKRASDFPRNKLTSDGLHSYCKRCKLAMDSASREKRKRMDNHAVRRSGPAPAEDAAQGGQAGLPGGGSPLQDMQHYCDTCKQLCMAQGHADGPELPPTMRCTACGSVALPIDPAVIQALDGAIAAHMPQPEYASQEPTALQAAGMQAHAAATYHLQLNSSEPPPAATMQIQMSAAQAAEAAHASPGGLSALLSDPAQLQQSGEGKICGACQVEKPLGHFPPSAACRDGLAPHCRDCIDRSGSGHPGYPTGSGQPSAAGLKRPGRRQRAQAHFPISEKVCRKCKANKTAADFPQKKSHPDGRDDYCKACHAKATAARVAARGPVKEPTVEAKVCSKCQEQKAASEFHRDCNKPDGLRGRCRACEAAAGQARRMARIKAEVPAAQARLCSRCSLEKPAGDFPQKVEGMHGLENVCKTCSSVATADHQPPPSGDHEGDVDLSTMYQQQAGLPEAQPLPPGSGPSLPYAAGLPAPLPLPFPPASAADGAQWPASLGSEEAAMAHRVALQTQHLMAHLQGMVPPGASQVGAVQGSPAGPPVHQEGHNMPMGSPASHGEPALHADASSGDPGYAVRQGDRVDAQQQREGTTQQESLEHAQDVEQAGVAHEEQYLANQQDGLQQGDTAGAQQLPQEPAAQQEAALRSQAAAEVEHSVDETKVLARSESSPASGMQQPL